MWLSQGSLTFVAGHVVAFHKAHDRVKVSVAGHCNLYAASDFQHTIGKEEWHVTERHQPGSRKSTRMNL